MHFILTECRHLINLY